MNKWKRKLKGFVTKKPFAFFDILIYTILDKGLFLQGAGLSYFLILAIFPFLIALLNIVRFVDASFLPRLIDSFESLPPDIDAILLSFVRDLEVNSSGTLLSVSLLGTIYVASNGIKQLVRSINDGISGTEKRGFLSLTLLSLAMTVSLFVLILMLMIAQVVGSNLLDYLFHFLRVPESAFGAISLTLQLVPLGFMFLSFFCLYYFSPKWPAGGKPPVKINLLSALFSMGATVIATKGFNYYVSNFASYSATYGSLAGIIIFLVWLYLFGLILLVGGAIQSTLLSLDQNGARWPREETLFSGVVASHTRIND